MKKFTKFNNVPEKYREDGTYAEQTDCHQLAFYRVSAIGLIRNTSGQVLMVNEHGHFTLPGGGWDYDESLHEALKREMYEEILLTSDFSERVITAIPFYNPKKDAWQMWVACEIIYDELNYGIGEHASAVEWFDPALLSDNTRAHELARQVLEELYEQTR